jgi:large subunit ribosomal protein L31
MKRDIHPVYQTCTVTCGCGNSFTTRSSKPKIAVEICSQCHPFFTGKQKFVDTAGMVEKFQKKYAMKDYKAAKTVKAKKTTKALKGTVLKGTNADLALAAAPGSPKAPVSAPGMKGGILGKPGKGGFGEGRGPGGPRRGGRGAPRGRGPAAKTEGGDKAKAGAPAAKAAGPAPGKAEGAVPKKAEAPAPKKAEAPAPKAEKKADAPKTDKPS